MRIVLEPRVSAVTGTHVSPDRPLDDIALMRRIASGETASLKEFYDRHSATVYTLALRMMKDAGEAEQLLTDVFFEIWESRARYDEARAAPRTYLMRLARSRAIDRMRRKGPIGTGDRRVTLDPAAGIDVAGEEALPGSAVEADEERVRVKRALNALEPEQRRAIECAYFDGLSHTQIAAELNKPLGTVKAIFDWAWTG